MMVLYEFEYNNIHGYNYEIWEFTTTSQKIPNKIRFYINDVDKTNCIMSNANKSTILQKIF